jgi:acyl-[acyl-carrier-protein]-phospholipid O-acyltransferase/long-chain-fatty-acid--[acyl-carrier-protein] ligase
MKQVITAGAFLDQVPVEVPGEAIYVDKILKTVTAKDRIIGLLLATLCPLTWIEKHLGAPSGRTSDELATVIFSSGSEGEPKGVMLTHFNVLSNVDAGIQGFPLNKGDRVMGILPFFHSFGYTGTLWLVLTQHLSAVYHTNPLEAKQIGAMVAQYKTKVLFTTSTFLQGLIRRCAPTQLSSLEFVIAGAEKLSPRVRDAFKEKYGVEPLEGYGTTECSPVVSLNVPDYRAPGFYQIGTKRGSIGHPIPGMSVRVIDSETREPLEQGETGLLLVKGPNVMKGYLNQPEKTAKVLKNGWYETGDIAVVDEDGFITITDRLARFSKIGGEMVSHTKVEESLQSLLEESDRVLAVAGVPDAQKGERLVVLHTLEEAQFDALISKIDDTGLPKLWIPKTKAYYRIDEIPILGTGKMDLSKLKTLARQLDAGE